MEMEMEMSSMNGEKKEEEAAKPITIRPQPCNSILSILAILLWLSGLYINGILAPLVFLLLPLRWSLLLLGFLIFLSRAPLLENSRLARGVSKFICKYGPSHFPITMIVEDIAAFDSNEAYIFAGEPHSVFPLGLVALLNDAGYLPLKKVKGLVTSVAFIAPIMRHVWTWVGLRPATMTLFLNYLRSGCSCILIPGGAREVLYLEHGREVVYLKKRYGFIRVAIMTGSPLVPVFVFGQTDTFSWYKIQGKLIERFCEFFGFTPLAFWGIFGSPIPYQRPMYIVVGRPIPVQKNDTPSSEEIEEVQTKFISALQELFEKHKAGAGYKGTPLFVY